MSNKIKTLAGFCYTVTGAAGGRVVQTLEGQDGSPGVSYELVMPDPPRQFCFRAFVNEIEVEGELEVIMLG